MHRLFFTSAAILGFLSVALGAFGAHGLKARLAALPDGADRLEWWKTAALYHLTHALALALTAGWFGDTRAGRFACSAFILGIVLFSGSLYTMTLTGVRWLGAVTPLGGLALLAGWALLAAASWYAR
ncbi:MAG: rane protein [Myxococcaceae bacterium]|nr:rane protein [Myxococcaceae bacterium]